MLELGGQARPPLPISRRRGTGPASEGPDEGIAFLKTQQPRNLAG